MSKEWFKHDYNSRNDLKMQALIHGFKAAGLGIYWTIVELLHEQNTHGLPLKKMTFQAIANVCLANASMVEKMIVLCISDYELFIEKEGFFYSNRVFKNVNGRSEISAKRSLSGKAGAIAKQKSANAKQKKAFARHLPEFAKTDELAKNLPDTIIDNYKETSNTSITLKERNIKERKIIPSVVYFLNEKTGKNFSATSKATVKHIQARLKEGRTLEDFRAVIEKKTQQWQGDEKMNEFLRPETLFGPKFESYLNDAENFKQPRTSEPDDRDEFVRPPRKAPGASVYSDNGQKNPHSE